MSPVLTEPIRLPQPEGPTLADRYHVDEITRQAKQVKPGVVVLSVIAAVLFGIGWIIAKVFGLLFFCGAWSAVAVRTGWREARGEPLSQPKLDNVLAENAKLRQEIQRLDAGYVPRRDSSVKAFVIFRDRVTYARQCVAGLLEANLDVHVVDHGSSWPAALAWLAELEADGVTVMQQPNNFPWLLWKWEPFMDVMRGDRDPYVVTDCDVAVAEDCPADWVEQCADVLKRSGVVKVGLSLRLDGLPHDARGQEIREWEERFWCETWEPGVYHASIDTTLALHRPWNEYPVHTLSPALRLAPPFSAEHLPWYERGDQGRRHQIWNVSPELDYYYEHADCRGHEVGSR